MEPLVLFGACLVGYCGYLAGADAVRAWSVLRLESRALREYRRKQAKLCRNMRQTCHQSGELNGKLLLQRA